MFTITARGVLITEDENKVLIGFTYKNSAGDEYSAESYETIYESIGETELEYLGTKFNAFLKQLGFPRKREMIFMEDITEKEYWELEDYLEKIRTEGV